jgi:hypothetical protein
MCRRRLNAEAGVRTRASPSGICGGQSGTGTASSSVLLFAPVRIILATLRPYHPSNAPSASSQQRSIRIIPATLRPYHPSNAPSASSQQRSVRIIPATLRTNLHLNTILIRRTSGRSLGKLKKSRLFRKSEQHRIGKVLSLFRQ